MYKRQPPDPDPRHLGSDGGGGEGGDEEDGGSSLTWGDAAPEEDGIPAGKGLLSVESRRRAMVWVGRRKVGLTPVQGLELDPGRYRIKVRSRHGLQRKRIRVRAGKETRVRFRL